MFWILPQGPGNCPGQLVCAASAAVLTHFPQRAADPVNPPGSGHAAGLQHARHVQGRPRRPDACGCEVRNLHG